MKLWIAGAGTLYPKLVAIARRSLKPDDWVDTETGYAIGSKGIFLTRDKAKYIFGALLPSPESPRLTEIELTARVVGRKN